MTLQSELKADEAFQSFKRICRSALSNVPISDIQSESKHLHSTRKTRKLTSARISLTSLEEAITNDMSVRSRLVELRVLVLRQLEVVDIAISSIRNHLRTSYDSYLDDYSSTESGKKFIVDKLLKTGLDVRSQLSSISSELELYIQDIDKSSYLSTNLTNIMRMTLERKSEYV